MRGVSKAVGIVIVVVIVAVIAAILAMQGQPAQMAVEEQPTAPAGAPMELKTITIGCLVDLSGPTSGVGVDVSVGQKAFVSAVNDGKITRLKELGYRLECIERDFAYKVPEAQTAYQAFKQQGVVMIWGWGTGDTLALAVDINRDGIPYTSYSYTVTLTNNPYNFFMMPTYQDQARAAVRFVKKYFEGKGLEPRLALTYPNVPYGLEPLPTIRLEAEKAGVTICAEEIVELTATTAREQLTRIRSKCGEDVAIWIGGTLSSAVVIAKSAYELGMERAILISNIWGFNEKTAKLLGPEATQALGGRLYRVTGAKMWDEVAEMDDPQARLLVQYITAQGVKTPTEVMVRAWINAYVSAKALEYLIEQGKEITPENIKWAFENMGPVETPFAPPIQFKPGDHRPGFTTFVYVMNGDGSWSQVDTVEVEELPLTNEAYGLDLQGDGVP